MTLFDTYKPHLEAMADLSGKIALNYFRSKLAIIEKSDQSPVTRADQEIETALRLYIEKHFPSHGFIGEEFGSINEGAPYTWVVDPIDGTRAFMTGKPLFGTIIGLVNEGRPLLGVLDQPFIKERWMGVHREMAFYNNTEITVAKPKPLSEARLFTGSPNMFFGKNFDRYLKLATKARWPQFGCDCYAYGLLAMGMADCVVEQHLKLHDVAGLIPIITGAGGYATDWQNRDILIPYTSGEFLATTHAALHQELLNILGH